jgi:hypothetical protein
MSRLIMVKPDTVFGYTREDHFDFLDQNAMAARFDADECSFGTPDGEVFYPISGLRVYIAG